MKFLKYVIPCFTSSLYPMGTTYPSKIATFTIAKYIFKNIYHLLIDHMGDHWGVRCPCGRCYFTILLCINFKDFFHAGRELVSMMGLTLGASIRNEKRRIKASPQGMRWLLRIWLIQLLYAGDYVTIIESSVSSLPQLVLRRLNSSKAFNMLMLVPLMLQNDICYTLL